MAKDIFWLVCVAITFAIGYAKGEAWGAFLAGCFLGPLGIPLALVSSGRRKKTPPPAQ